MLIEEKKHFSIKDSIQKAERSQKKINAFTTIFSDAKVKKEADKESLLYKVPYGIKDNISTKGKLTTGSSKILSNYRPVFDASIIKKLDKAGAVMIGKTVLDELGMGGSGIGTATGPVLNPYDQKRIIGGSSAGSAAAVAANIVPFAIGSDTGDSIRKPAAYGGVVGFKPSYGRVSRYGLFPFASSLDHIGCITRSVKDAAIVVDAIKGYDPKDATSLKDEKFLYSSKIKEEVKGKKLFYIKEIVQHSKKEEKLTKTIEEFEKAVEIGKKSGFQIDEVSIDKKILEAIYGAYISISCAEAASNNANLTGLLFGPRGEGEKIQEVIFNARNKGFGELIKRRFVIGSYILQKENSERLFINAKRVRRVIVEKINKLFKEYDAFILPASKGPAPIINSKEDKLSSSYLMLENHMVIGNFGGFPSITIPSGFVDDLPVGLNITGRFSEDLEVLKIAKLFEEKIGLKDIKKEVC